VTQLLELAAAPASWWPTDQGAAPIYATPRTPGLYSDGPGVRVIARSLGTPLIPWQDHVAVVANERNPDGSYHYPVVVVSVPRQTGKTTLIRANGVHRCTVCGQDVYYTAQTGKDARARWMDMVKAMRASELWASKISVALRAGAESVAFPNLAEFHAFAPTATSLHGSTPATVKLDEAFAHSPQVGELLMGAIEPAQFTIHERQLWIVSTAGTAESTFLHDWIDVGMGGAPGVATFLWGARPDQNPYDLGDIARFHPGVGYVLNGKLLTPQDVLGASERTTRAEYERAYANRRTRTSRDLIPADLWAALSWAEQGLEDVRPPTEAGKLHLVYDVAHDRSAAGVMVAWRTDPDSPHVRLKTVFHAAGVSWLPAKVLELRDQLAPAKVRAAGNGPVREVTEQLAGRCAVDVLTEEEYGTACGRFLTLVGLNSEEPAQLDHDGQRVLAESVSGLVPRTSGTDGVAFSRKQSMGDTSLGVAAAIAAWSAAISPWDQGPLWSMGAPE
jgi:hypothetical protein